MLRRIIKIDEAKCDGCGRCVAACHEGAIGIVSGKAKLLRDDYCDGLGDCLPTCPLSAISFEEREAAPYNEAEVNMSKQQQELPCGCPGTHAKPIHREGVEPQINSASCQVASQLKQWPVQIKLVSANAAYFRDADLLVSADCAAYAYGNFHNDFMRGKITIIGCPKLDDGDYCEKLTAIIRDNNIRSVTVARMEVPCCGGIENAVRAALQNCGKAIPCQVIVIGTEGGVRCDK